MNAAWQQIGDVLAANNRIRLAQLAQAARSRGTSGTSPRSAERAAFVLTAPVHDARASREGTTVAALVRRSVVPAAATSAPFRPAHAPGHGACRSGWTCLARPPPRTSSAHQRGELVRRAAEGRAAGRHRHRTTPSTPCAPSGEPPARQRLLESYPWLRFLPLAAARGGRRCCRSCSCSPARLVAVLAVARAGARGLSSAAVALGRPSRLAQSIAGGAADARVRGRAADCLQFRHLAARTRASRPRPGATRQRRRRAVQERAARRLHASRRSLSRSRSASRSTLAALAAARSRRSIPAITVRERVLGTVYPAGVDRDNMVEKFTPVMAYPVFDVPMYKPLRDLSAELFLPQHQPDPAEQHDAARAEPALHRGVPGRA